MSPPAYRVWPSGSFLDGQGHDGYHLSKTACAGHEKCRELLYLNSRKLTVEQIKTTIGFKWPLSGN